MKSEMVLHRLSESQKSIWYLEKAHPGTSMNIVAGNLHLTGDVDYRLLEKAIQIFVKRNDSMRIRIVEKDGDAYQYVESFSGVKVDFLDFSANGGLKALFEWDDEITKKPFDITRDQLFYCAIYKVSDDESGFYMKMHHLISDAWTMGLTTRQVIDTYSKLKKGLPVDETPKPSYLEHLRKNAEYEASGRFEKDRKYWSQKFETLPDLTTLKPLKSGDNPIRARRKTMITPVKFSNKLREFSQENNLSVFTLLMAALAIYIYRVTGNEDMVLGTTILNRVNAREKDTTGMFISVAAPIRIAVSHEMDFKTFAREMLRESTEVLKHQKYPYNYLLRDLKKKHKLTGKLFDIVLSYQNSKFHKGETGEDYTAKWLFSGYQIESLVISINDREDGGNLIIDYDFLTDIFSAKEIEFIHQHILRLLWHALDNPTRSISKLEMISEKEKNALLYELNATEADYPCDKTLHQIFEEQVLKTPERTALIYAGKKMTYDALNRKANRLARLLRQNGVGPDSIVALMTYRSFEMIIAILAVLKAGGAYLPIDPDYPAGRKKDILDDSRTGVLLTQNRLLAGVCFDGLIIDLEDEKNYLEDETNLPGISRPKDLAYVIYTSGSTGRPKGVMIEHTGVVNRINWMLHKYPFNENSVIMQKTAYTFDVSVWELFSWAFIGAALCLIKTGEEKDPEAMICAVERHRITAMHFVPSMLTAFLSYVEATNAHGRLSTLQNVFASGEALMLSQVGKFNDLLFKGNGTRLSNLYGPTEATVEVSYFECSPEVTLDSVPIGKPIDNISLYVFDKNRTLLPVGIPGELYIGGVGVARGYLYNPVLTREKFIVNPYKPGEMLYRTGDRVRRYAKGDVEFLGRMDYQVKIRGFRIELGEIESRLAQYPTVREAVVKAYDGTGGSAYLAAYVAVSRKTDPIELQTFLSEALPDYMVPDVYSFLDQMPLNSSGKVDRKALKEPERGSLPRVEFVPPANEIESELVELWRDILGIEQIGVLDTYSSLGGDSLSVIKIITHVHKRFGAELSPREIFSLQTIRKLAEKIRLTAGGEKVYTVIPRVSERECYPVSSTQKRQYILNRLDDDISYNLPGSIELEGRLDTARVEAALKKLLVRHESLRTGFELRDGEPVQIVRSEVPLSLEYIQADGEDANALMAAFARPFDLSRAPLFRAGLVGLSEARHLLLFDMHHIISDGASVDILIREFGKLYAGDELPPLKIQYKDYAVWHNALLASEAMKEQEAYWLERFSGELPVLNMPLDHPRPIARSGSGSRVRFTVDKKLTSGLKKLAAETGTTLFMVLMAAYNILLSKYTGQEDIIIGTPVEGRRHADLHGLIGMFVNTLAIRSYPAGEKTVSDFLGEIRDDLLNAFENQDYPFEELVDKAGVRRDVSRNPLFDTLLALKKADYSQFKLGELSARLVECDLGTSKFDLTIEAVDRGETLALDIEYDTALFERETVERLGGHFMNVLKAVTEDPSKKLRDLTLLSEDECRQLLYDFNDTAAGYPHDKTLHQLFEEQVSKTPDNIALVLGDETMTYRQLNKSANRVGRTLRACGVEPDTVVGLIADRSFEMVIGILAILKAGGAYMPIDPDYPAQRKTYMLENSGAKALLTKRAFAVPFEGASAYLDDASAYDRDASNLEPVNTPSDLAYILYTSGSTGRPKGVMIEHHNIVGLLSNDRFGFKFSADDVWVLFHSYCFDFTGWEIYGPLMHGGKLIIIKREVTLDQGRYLELLKKEHVTVLTQTPQSLYNLVNLELQSEKNELYIRYVFFGGEVLKPSLLKPLKDKYPQAEFINLYGPTETTIFVTFKRLCEADFTTHFSNIGPVVPMMKAYVTDKNLELAPIGVPGELCVAGNGVGRGYINNSALTQERFIDNPFSNTEGLLYKTSDLVKWTPDGELLFLGRVDSQVKIRGYRIELGELENVLLEHEAVEETIAVAYEANGGRKLCVYYKAQTELTNETLTDFLLGKLPEYMVPSVFIRLEKFPLNTSGKVDKAKLPHPNEHISRAAFVQPSTELEKTVAEVWAQTLDFTDIGASDNFFELGGTSLNAVTMTTVLNKQLGIELSARHIFEHPTVRQLAGFISKRPKKDFLAISAVDEKTFYPVSSAQKRQYILRQMEGGGIGYNVSFAVLLEGRLDTARVEAALKKLLARHESLRTGFELRDGEPVQIVRSEVPFSLEYMQADGEDANVLMAAFVRPFDLSRAPLFRAGLVGLSEERHLLLFDMHHIISDGASVDILIREFGKLYAGDELPPLKIQYKDYAAWHNTRLVSEAITAQEAYWMERFSGELPVLNMPLDHPRPTVRSGSGSRVRFTVDKKLTGGLKKLAAETGTTLFMVLMAAYNILLSKYTGQEDIIIGTPVEGRRHADLHGLIGMFVNTLAIRSYPAGEKTVSGFLEEIRDDLLNAFENQDYPFEELVDKAGVRRDVSRNPLFDTMLALQKADYSQFKLGELSARLVECDLRTSKFDLTIEAVDRGETLALDIEYDIALFERATVERLGGHFMNVLAGMALNPLKKLKKMTILSEEERSRILHDFNDTAAGYPHDKTLHQLFEEQVSKTPDNIALALGDKTMTYRQLSESANRLGRTLRANGVGPDTVVGLIADRSFEMIIGIFAILKAGGAYMPIDPEHPDERKAYMLENSGATVLLTKRSLAVPFDGDNVYLDDPTAYDSNAANLEPVNTPSNLAYILYTSGSTGRPKGVMIEHHNIVGLLFNDRFGFKFSADDVWTLFHSYCFDFTGWEIYGPLMRGGKLIIIKREVTLDQGLFLELLKKERVTVLTQTPQSLYNLVNLEQQSVKNELYIRYVFFGGEALKPSLLKPLRDKYPQAEFINLYGPTETTIFVTFKSLREADFSTHFSNIGSVVPLMKAYVTDRHLELAPIGVPGELCVAGNGVGRGYITNSALTEARFIDNPFSDTDGPLYRTSDLVKWTPDGELLFLERMDSQVKIRGYRIELGEIENVLLEHEAVEEAVVVSYEANGGSQKLCAYIKSKTELATGELVSFLSGRLPDYMVPSLFIRLEALPLNTSGKIDKAKLPRPAEGLMSRAEYTKPRNVAETLMADLWADVLALPAVGIDDDFFELGGDSLSAVKVISRMKQPLRIIDLYTSPTIRLLAEKISQGQQKPGLLVNLSKRYDPKNCSVICVPYGGGSALAYKDLSLSDYQKNAGMNIYAVNLPGHDFRPSDELKSIESLAVILASEINKTIPGDIILFGHSAGSTLTLETARLLEKDGRTIKAVFIGGQLAPRLTRFYGWFYTPWRFSSNKQIIRKLKSIGLPAEVADSEYVRHFIQAYRHDALCSARYFFALSKENIKLVNAPMYFLAGDKDPATKHYAKRYADWNKYFRTVKLLVLENAKHYFINTHSDILIDYLSGIL